MIGLILVILSIGLFSLFLLIGINHVNPTQVRTSQYVDTIKISFMSMKQSIDSYEKVYRVLPSEADWESELFPTFGIKPEAPIGEWNISTIEGKYSICLNLNDNAISHSVANKIETDLRFNIDLNKGCLEEENKISIFFNVK